MGRLNSNEIPPNPFIHGWSAPAAASPEQTAPRTPPPSPIISPLERTRRIVSQPLPSSTRRPRRNFSFGWLTGLFLPVGLIFAFTIGVGLLSNAPPPLNSRQPNPSTNHIPNPSVPSQAFFPTRQPESTAKQATAGISTPVLPPAPVSAPAEASQASVGPTIEMHQPERQTVVVTPPVNDSAPALVSLGTPRASLAPTIPTESRPNIPVPTAQFEPPHSPTPPQTRRFPMAPKIAQDSPPSTVCVIPQAPVYRTTTATYSYPIAQQTPVFKTPANAYSYSATPSTPVYRAPSTPYSYPPIAQPAPEYRVPGNVYSYSSAQPSIRVQVPRYFVVIPARPAYSYSGGRMFTAPPMNYRVGWPSGGFAQPQMHGQGGGGRSAHR